LLQAISAFPLVENGAMVQLFNIPIESL